MFDAMGVNYAGTLLGGVAVLLVPIPAAFYYYGGKIRARSAYAPTAKAPQESDDELAGGVEKTNSGRSMNGENAV